MSMICTISGLMATKIGMTRVFSGVVDVPVTLLKLEDNVVLRVGKEHATKGVEMIIGCKTVAAKNRNLSKSLRGIANKAGIESFRNARTIYIKGCNSDELNNSVGKSLGMQLFSVGQVIDVTGTSIGKGFAGGMKRHNFSGLEASHGVSLTHRSLGSTGQRQDPGKVFKGKKMAGHMGDRRVTKLNLSIVDIDPENNIIAVKGAVPGSKGGLIMISNRGNGLSLSLEDIA